MKKASLKQIGNYLLILGLFFTALLFKYYYDQQNKIITYIKELKYPTKDILFLSADQKSGRSLKYINSIEDYIQEKGVEINFGIVYPEKKSIIINGKQADEKIIRKLKMGKDHFKLYSSQGRLIKTGNIFLHINSLVLEIDRNNENSEPKEIRISGKICDYDPFGFILDDIKDGVNCFIFHETICTGCRSGIDFIIFDKLTKKYPDLNLNYITLSDYTKEDITRIKRNGGYITNVIIADDVCRKWWEANRKIKEIPSVNHNLAGMTLACDNDGFILFSSNRMSEFLDWLEELKGGSLRVDLSEIIGKQVY
jgi:hypothetical protein